MSDLIIYSRDGPEDGKNITVDELKKKKKNDIHYYVYRQTKSFLVFKTVLAVELSGTRGILYDAKKK